VPSPYTGRDRTTNANERDGILLPQPKTAEHIHRSGHYNGLQQLHRYKCRCNFCNCLTI
jgi:hypothetical protein